jgi:BCD family chlorophyll transporter-like MFS transporter
VLSRGFDPFRMANYGALVGIPAFMMVCLAAPMSSALLFGAGTALIGFGAGLFGHGTLTATMQMAPPGQTGLALGAWGAVQATAAGVAVAAGGVIRDIVAALSAHQVVPPLGAHQVGTLATGYVFVYILEIILLLVTLAAMTPLLLAPAEPAIAEAGILGSGD